MPMSPNKASNTHTHTYAHTHTHDKTGSANTQQNTVGNMHDKTGSATRQCTQHLLIDTSLLNRMQTAPPLTRRQTASQVERIFLLSIMKIDVWARAAFGAGQMRPSCAPPKCSQCVGVGAEKE